MVTGEQDDLYRILSLDGGGTWAFIEAAALGDLYGLHTPGRQILSHFNLAIANSGGSLVVAGLILDMTPAAILDLFFDVETRKSIFVAKTWIERLLDFGIFRKYQTAEKINGLKNAFYRHLKNNDIETDLSAIHTKWGITTDILIPAFDYDRERAVFFRSRSNSKAGRPTKGLTLCQAIHASSTAPVKYFDDPADLILDRRKRFWDGGVGGFNNPVMAGVVEALANHPEKRGNIRVLSLGTGNNLLPLWEGKLNYGLHKPPQEPGLISDIGLLARAIISDPPDAASFTAHVVLEGRLPDLSQGDGSGRAGDFVKNLVRMNPMVQPKSKGSDWDFPGIAREDFIRLTELELDAIDEKDVKILRRFTKAWLEDVVINQAIRSDGYNLKHHIGHEKYSQALNYWRTVDDQVLKESKWTENHQALLRKLQP